MGSRQLFALVGSFACFHLLWPLVALTQTFEARESAQAGRPPKPVSLRVTADAEGVRLFADRATVELPIDTAVGLSAQSVEIAQDATVAVVRVEGGQGQRAEAIVSRRGGRAQILWSGRVGLWGDPGERHGHAVEIVDRTGDGTPDVIVGELAERACVCGQERTLLRPRAVDPRSLTLRPVTLDPLGGSALPLIEAAATPDSPGPSGPPLLRGLKPRGASSQPGQLETWMANPPTGVADGQATTYWMEGRGAGGRGEFVSLGREGAALPIRALALTPVPSEPPATAWSRVAAVWLVGDEGPRIKLTLPDTVEPGRRYWFVPEQPLPWACLSVIVERSASGSRAAGPVVLAEVEAYTDLDFDQGRPERLVAELRLGDERAARAADLLIALRDKGLPLLTAAWPQLDARARRRALRVFERTAAEHEAARLALVVALDDAQAEIRDAALAALLAVGKAGWDALLPQIARQSALGDQVALALARRAPGQTVDAALAALSADGGSDRAALREALSRACAAGGELAPIERWLETETATPAARAAVALALSSLGRGSPGEQLAARLLLRGSESAGEFADRWRLVQASRVLPPDERVDRWLSELALKDEHWMLRAAAVKALHERTSPLAAQTARKAMEDSYPRVRLAGAEALHGVDAAIERLTKHARQDRWPMVRAAALLALAESKGTREPLLKGLSDSSQSVRAAAVTGLRLTGARDAWGTIRECMLDQAEWPIVVTEAVRFARDLCIAEAAEPLLALLRRGLEPNAWEPDVQVALLALEALTELGGKPAKSAIALASAPVAPSGFKAAARAAESQKPKCSRVHR